MAVVLMQDARANKAPFMGLEFGIGNDATRSIVIGFNEEVTSYDKNGGGAAIASIPLVDAGSTTTQEIVFRIDYGASDVDTLR